MASTMFGDFIISTLLLFILQDGQTPLMKACQSSVDRPSKVRYLDEEGADCRAKDFVKL